MPTIADDRPATPSDPTSSEPAGEAPATEQPAADAAPADPPPSQLSLTPALARFHSCRWRAQPEEGLFCTHRDVLPIAGRTGFNPEAWCPDCRYFKVRRTPRKRQGYEY
ncbi:MAG TPA: hypothetical protein VNI83_02945 [Vicinamibacterales bacterium]|nr:hypothetical protein [Vicinamibacterales bacterium]